MSMRAGFGLVGLLITIGVIVWFMYKIELPHDQAVISAGNQARAQLEPLSAEGVMKFEQSIDLDLESSGGRTNSVLVTNVVAGGPAANYFGLMRGDSIMEIGPLSVRDSVSSREDARAYVTDAYQRKQSLTVIRDGQKIMLPQPGA